MKLIYPPTRLRLLRYPFGPILIRVFRDTKSPPASKFIRFRLCAFGSHRGHPKKFYLGEAKSKNKNWHVPLSSFFFYEWSLKIIRFEIGGRRAPSGNPLWTPRGVAGTQHAIPKRQHWPTPSVAVRWRLVESVAVGRRLVGRIARVRRHRSRVCYFGSLSRGPRVEESVVVLRARRDHLRALRP